MKKRRRGPPGWLLALLITGALFSVLLLPRGGLWFSILALGAVGVFCGVSIGKAKRKMAEREQPAAVSSRTEATDLTAGGRRAIREMQRLRALIPEADMKAKIDRLIEVSEKIVSHVAEDPSDANKVQKFLDYYLPTTTKLLDAYARMSGSGATGDNVERSRQSISAMLDTAVEAYNRQLDSLFENQALDIETDISVMNSLLAREGLTGSANDNIILDAARGTGNSGSAAATQTKEE